MNTGIGDAVNLGWKLAHVLQQRASASLLDTYEPERISFARQLISSTDRAFTAMVGEDLRGEFTRQLVAPLVFFAGTRFLPHVLFRRVSQVQVQYPGSPLSEGKAGKIAGGDRLPWTGLEVDNYAPLRSLDWQVHVYGTPPNALRETCDLLRLPLHTFAWLRSRERPDSHVTRFTLSGRTAMSHWQQTGGKQWKESKHLWVSTEYEQTRRAVKG